MRQEKMKQQFYILTLIHFIVRRSVCIQIKLYFKLLAMGKYPTLSYKKMSSIVNHAFIKHYTDRVKCVMYKTKCAGGFNHFYGSMMHIIIKLAHNKLSLHFKLTLVYYTTYF